MRTARRLCLLSQERRGDGTVAGCPSVGFHSNRCVIQHQDLGHWSLVKLRGTARFLSESRQEKVVGVERRERTRVGRGFK